MRPIRGLPVVRSRVGVVRGCWIAASLMLAATAAAQSNNTATITIRADEPGAVISSNLFGIFFEELSSAGDGGLYAELVRNRSFEDSANSLPYWSVITTGTAAGQIALDSSAPLSAVNRQALKLTMTGGTGTVGTANRGYWGIPVTDGATYNLGFYARGGSGFSGPITVMLESTNGSTVYAQGSVAGLTTGWQHYSVSLVPNATDPYAQLVLSISQPETVYLDFVSLFPAETFKHRSNGLRSDLANLLLQLHPSFVRFPGGAWVDGAGVADFYNWETTIGDPANRIPRYDLWGYMVDNGLGYHEYLQLCEDLGAEPLFVVNCGMDYSVAVPTDQIAPYVQEALDAIQYANGATNTLWGALRAANGHPAPFHLHYLEIGNENSGSAYNDHYAVFYDAIKAQYPDIQLIANSPVTSRPMDILDEHYYPSATWFIQNASHYDNYDRRGPKIFVGEYAARGGAGNGSLAGAIGEAAWMTGLERNGDIVAMASYAPLFANLNDKDWNPDLIYFTGTQAYGQPSYYVQQMFSDNHGDYTLPATIAEKLHLTNALPHGAVGLGSWNTSVQYTNLVVTSNGVTLYASDFASQSTNGWRVYGGTWSVNAGLYQQTAITTDCRSTTGDTNWANYTITLQARKVSGKEGFLILFNWLDDNNWTWWNIAGWNNTLDGIEQMVDGAKSLVGNQVAESINPNQWYNIRIVLTGPRIQCYLDGNLVHDVTYPSAAGSVLASVTYARASSQIIAKAVNASPVPVDTTFSLSGLDSIAPTATLLQLTSASPSDENSLASPTHVYPVTNTIYDAGTNFTLTLPANSLSILRLQASGIHTCTNLLLELPSPINSGQVVQATLWGQLSDQADPIDLTANPSHAITWTSANTNIVAVDATGHVMGIASGTTAIIAAYSSIGLSATQWVQVIAVPTTLVHRYSFNDPVGSTDVVDSVGGPAWDGSLPNGGTFGNGQLALSAAGQQYVRLPAGILSNYSAVTIETWVTFPDQLPVNCFFFGFGNTNGNLGENYIFCAPQGGRIAITSSDYSGEQNAFSGVDFSYRTNFHLVAVFNPPAGYVALYTNGVLAAINNNVTVPFSSVQDVFSYIGRSLYSQDPYPDFRIDEFRIYNGPLHEPDIAATQALGPDQALTAASPSVHASLSGDNLSLSWPLSSPGFTVFASTNLAAGAWTAIALAPQILDGQWEITLPHLANTEFFRLQK